jgi:hypothetical protein
MSRLAATYIEFAADRRLELAQDASGPRQHLYPRLIRAEPPGVQLHGPRLGKQQLIYNPRTWGLANTEPFAPSRACSTGGSRVSVSANTSHIPSRAMSLDVMK